MPPKRHASKTLIHEARAFQWQNAMATRPREQGERSVMMQQKCAKRDPLGWGESVVPLSLCELCPLSSRQQRMPYAPIVAAVIVAALASSRVALATGDTEVVDFDLTTSNQIAVSVNESDFEYMELLRHVFEAVGERPVAVSSAYYVVSKSAAATLRQVDGTIVMLSDANSITFDMPLEFSLAPGDYCQRLEATILRSSREPRLLTRTSCFAVDSTGTASLLSNDDVSALVHAIQSGVDATGRIVPEISGEGALYDEAVPMPTTMQVGTLVHSAWEISGEAKELEVEQ